ncbi:MAG: hypothetical protein PHG75_08145 [Syntrophomonas sp.]|nr:hypothetical protein [Syntrophomonas sp.]
MSPVLKVQIAKPSASGIVIFLLLACLLINLSSGQSPPVFQSVSGEFAQKWIKDYKKESGIADPAKISSNQSQDNDSDLWSWGNAPRGSKIVDGQLERDANYLRPLLNLTSNWLDELYTDSDTGLPMEVYSDPVTGRKYYHILNPNTGIAFFTYCTYEDEKTGQTVYVYVDPDTGKEVQATSAPVAIIKSLAGSLADNLI